METFLINGNIAQVLSKRYDAINCHLELSIQGLSGWEEKQFLSYKSSMYNGILDFLQDKFERVKTIK